VRAPRAAWLAALLAAACAGGAADAPAPDRAHGVAMVESEAVHGFHARAATFYGRLARRRFNTRVTYKDPGLRGFFETEAAFADYYAELAQALLDAAFEKNRPVALDVLEFSFEAPGQARVRVRLLGEDARPLRWGQTELVRTDRWERRQGIWWLVPGKL
jgi:hypothetical protein